MNENFIQEYVNLIVECGKAQDEANSKKSNKIFDLKNIYVKEIKVNMNLYRNELIKLLNHENNYVKSEIAYLLLPCETEKAVAVLEVLSLERSLLGFSARMTLRLWKEGKLKY